MKSKIFLSLLLNAIVYNTAFGQFKVDSLRNIWKNTANLDSVRFNAINEYYEEVTYSRPDSAFSLFRLHSNLAIEKGNKKELAKAIDNKALVYCIQGKLDNAIIEMKKVIDISLKLDDFDYLAAKQSNLGTIYYYRNEYLEAMRYFYQSKEVLEKNRSSTNYADVLNNIGIVYYDLNSWDLALDKFHEALKEYEIIKVEDKTGEIWFNIGMIHLEKSNIEKSLLYGKIAYPMLHEQNNLFSAAKCCQLLSESYREMGEIDSAFHYKKESIRINKELGNPINILEAEVSYIDLLYDKDVLHATELAEGMLPAVEALADYNLKKDIYGILYKCYKYQENDSKALTMHEKHSLYDDSIRIKTDRISVIREDIERDFKSKLLIKELDSEEKQSELKNRYFRKTSIIGIVGFLSMVALYFVARYKIRSHKEQKHSLLLEIEELKKYNNTSVTLQAKNFQLDRERIENETNRKLNETDWKVLNILLDDPVISNKGMAEKAFLSVDGIGSSLRRMYGSFNIKESKYKKISLIMKAIKLSNF